MSKNQNYKLLIFSELLSKHNHTFFQHLFLDEDTPNNEPLTANKNVAGIAIVGILAVAIFVVIGLICYAQKNYVSNF